MCLFNLHSLVCERIFLSASAVMLLQDSSICATEIDKRLSVVNICFFDLADKDRMIATIANLFQAALQICECVDKHRDPFYAGADLDIFEFITRRCGKSLRKIGLRFIQNVDDK